MRYVGAVQAQLSTVIIDIILKGYKAMTKSAAFLLNGFSLKICTALNFLP